MLAPGGLFPRKSEHRSPEADPLPLHIRLYFKKSGKYPLSGVSCSGCRFSVSRKDM